MNTVVKIQPKDVGSIPYQEASFDIWDKKYRLTSKDGSPVDKSMDDTYKRVARALADVESEQSRDQWYESFLWALRHGAIPAGRVTSNAGALEHKPATSTINCTVSGTIRDSMDDILKKVHEAGLTLKAGCGIGYEFSTLRPRGAYVSGAGAYTSGPLSFMDIYDKMCFTVSSAGGRRGAQMGTFDIGHPDALEFIRAKRENGRLRQFNLSLLVTDEFMKAVKSDGDWTLAFPIGREEFEAEQPDLTNASKFVWREWPYTEGYVANDEGLVACKIYKTLPARRVWDVIMTSTYDFAEPGFILIDKVNEMNNNWWTENVRATNPCGEQPLPAYGSCLLGSVNLTKFVVDPFTEDARFDWETYRKVVKVFTRMLDNVVEVNGLPLAQQRDEIRRAETVVAHFHHMTQCAAFELARQQFEKFAEIGFVELFGRRELPQHRTEPVAQFEHAGIIKPLYGIAGFREHPPVGREARSLQREHKSVRHLAGPFAKAFRLLRAVIGAVDLDRGELRARIFELFRLRETLGIEDAAPRLKGPASDADSDLARRRPLCSHVEPSICAQPRPCVRL